MSTRIHLLFGILAISLAMALGLVNSSGQASPVAVGVIYVDADATGAGNGSSWTDAFTALQPALEAAGSGDQIWVAQGTYIPTNRFDPLDPRSASFLMKNGLAIYGGFAGGETELAQRDWENNPTILSGDIGAAGEAVDNSYHVFYNERDVHSSAILDGFTITGGNANLNTYPHMYGGGMNNYDSSPTLINVTFSANAANSGGGMYNYRSSPSLTRVTFSANAVSYGGGGMYNDNYSNPTLTEVIFFDNAASYGGGGMYNYMNSSPTLMEVTFFDNSATYMGGGIWNYGSSPLLTNVTFSANTAGGGGGMASQYSAAKLTNVQFFGNYARGGGGGMGSYVGNISLVNVIFFANTAAGGGGGISNSLSCSSPGSNVIFLANSAVVGGAMANRECDPILSNVTFFGNIATESGGGIFNRFSSPTLTNAILWGDSPGEIFNEDSYSIPLVTYSDIQGGYAGEGNIDLDPRFVRPPSPGGDGIWGTADDDPGDLRLFLSPAIDAGNNAAVPPGITTDMLGQPRFVDVLAILDTGLGTPPLVDMGAYEAQYGYWFLPLVWR